MHDLRKKALLESGKTQSRKARSRPDSKSATPITSPGHSPAGSRAPSRYASEDEGDSDSDFDDMMTMSTTSGTSDHGDDDGTGRAWVDRLSARVSQIVAGGRSGERKKISNQEREDMLRSYLHLARHYFVRSEIEAPMNDLVLGLVRAIKSGVSVTERTLALKAFSVTILTNPTDTVLDQYVSSLRSTCEDDGAEVVKTAALRALAVAAMYGDGSTEAAEDMMLYMLAIIESDGHTVGAADIAPVVVAALESWGFMAAHLEDLSEQSEQALEAFVEQLDSTDAYVQTGAGNNIALLFESATELEESSGEKMNLRYDPKRLAQQMREASRGSKSMSKRDRRHLKSDFNSIATGLERGKGPGYSTAGWAASNPHTGGNAVVSSHGGDVNEFGYRQTISVGKDKMTIDSWALSAKVDFLRTVLAGGFPTHLAKNETVQEMI